MQEAGVVAKPSVASRFVGHLWCMPAWHRHVLLAALAIGAVGVVGRVRQFAGIGYTPSQNTSVTAAQSAPGTTPQNNFGADHSVGSPTATDPNAADAAAQPWYLSPKFLSLGGSVVGGFIIGWMMRVFIKTTLLIGLGIGAILSALSHFHVMNIDFSSVQQQYSGDLSWLTQQATILKNAAIAHLPMHAGGIFGMFMGFRRPRM
jgi:uncharacterized membrane protein (Fun14 family)